MDELLGESPVCLARLHCAAGLIVSIIRNFEVEKKYNNNYNWNASTIATYHFRTWLILKTNRPHHSSIRSSIGHTNQDCLSVRTWWNCTQRSIVNPMPRRWSGTWTISGGETRVVDYTHTHTMSLNVSCWRMMGQTRTTQHVGRHQWFRRCFPAKMMSILFINDKMELRGCVETRMVQTLEMLVVGQLYRFGGTLIDVFQIRAVHVMTRNKCNVNDLHELYVYPNFAELILNITIHVIFQTELASLSLTN